MLFIKQIADVLSHPGRISLTEPLRQTSEPKIVSSYMGRCFTRFNNLAGASKDELQTLKQGRNDIQHTAQKMVEIAFRTLPISSEHPQVRRQITQAIKDLTNHTYAGKQIDRTQLDKELQKQIDHAGNTFRKIHANKPREAQQIAAEIYQDLQRNVSNDGINPFKRDGSKLYDLHAMEKQISESDSTQRLKLQLLKYADGPQKGTFKDVPVPRPATSSSDIASFSREVSSN